MSEVTFKGIEVSSANLALQEVEASGRGLAINCSGRYFVTTETETDRLAAAGISFAFLTLSFGRDGSDVLMTVPVN